MVGYSLSGRGVGQKPPGIQPFQSNTGGRDAGSEVDMPI